MELRERIAGLMQQARTELGELVAIRSVADPRQFPPEECAAAAQWVLGKFSELGFSDVRLAETADGSQAVVGSRSSSDADCPNRAAVRALRRPTASRRVRVANPAVPAHRGRRPLVRPRRGRLQGQYRRRT